MIITVSDREADRYPQKEKHVDRSRRRDPTRGKEYLWGFGTRSFSSHLCRTLKIAERKETELTSNSLLNCSVKGNTI